MRRKRSPIRIIAATVIASTFLITALIFTLYGFAAVQLFNNPEGVGEWFSRLISGFENK